MRSDRTRSGLERAVLRATALDDDASARPRLAQELMVAARREIASGAGLLARRAHRQPPAPKAGRGALAKCALPVGSASRGATTHPGSHQVHSAVFTPQHIRTDINQGVTA